MSVEAWRDEPVVVAVSGSRPVDEALFALIGCEGSVESRRFGVEDHEGLEFAVVGPFEDTAVDVGKEIGISFVAVVKRPRQDVADGKSLIPFKTFDEGFCQRTFVGSLPTEFDEVFFTGIPKGFKTRRCGDVGRKNFDGSLQGVVLHHLVLVRSEFEGKGVYSLF